MLSVQQVHKAWTAKPNVTYGMIERMAKASSFEVFCLKFLCRGMGDKGAAQWTAELASRFCSAVKALEYTRNRYPTRTKR